MSSLATEACPTRYDPPATRWEGARMGVDRTVALTVISPIAPGWTPATRLVLQVLPHTPWGTSEELQELAFIQSARWSILTGAPGQSRFKYDYLLFESNFNGTLEAYLQAFADVLGDKIRLIWNSSLGFPNLPQDAGRSRLRQLRRPIPGRAFVSYVSGASLPVAHFYAAYPTASNTEVLAGLQAERALVELRGTALGQAGADHFRTRFVDTLVHLQGRPELAEQPAGAGGDVRGRQYAFTGLSPIRPDRVDALRATLAALPTGVDSPFAGIPEVHFGRWVIVDSVPRQPGQRRDGWQHPYLLTTTTSDGTSHPLRQLHRGLGPARDLVYGECLGYPSTPHEDDFVAYHLAHQVPTSRFYTGYPQASTAAVRSGLRAHDRLTAFARRTSGLPAPTLLAEFEAEFLR